MSRRPPIRSASLALLLAACTFNQNEGFIEVSASFATAPGEPVEVYLGRYAYVAVEALQGAAGQDLNEDGDTLDRVAVVGRLGELADEIVPVSPRQMMLNDNEDLFLAVEEADEGFDWSGDGVADDRVLLHWARDPGIEPRVAFIDLLEPGLGEQDFELVRGRTYYAVPDPSTDTDGSNLRYCSFDNPREPVAVAAGEGAGARFVRLLDQEAELLLLLADETQGGTDLNDDTDASDTAVLEVLDATEAETTIVGVGLALNPADPQVAARRELDGQLDWRLAFLVSEGDQGGTNLNDPALFEPAWVPAACVGNPDTDDEDDVLHTVRVLELTDPDEPVAPTNTGLAGRDRVVIVQDGVATLVDELDLECDLNGDGDQGDTIARYTSTELPILPNVLPEDMHDIAPLPGGALGLNGERDVFLAVVDELGDGRDHDGDGELTRNLLAWVDPTEGGPWEFEHRDTDGPSFFVAVSWMDEEVVNNRVAMTFLEEAQQLTLNNACTLQAKDEDFDDALPAWPRFDGTQLVVPGVGFAVPPSDPGIVLFANFVFFRVSESLDNRDHNLDGDLDDLILVRNPIFACDPEVMDTASMELEDVVELGGFFGGAFVASEPDVGVDFNEDGDSADLVVRHFRF